MGEALRRTKRLPDLERLTHPTGGTRRLTPDEAAERRRKHDDLVARMG